MKEAEEFAEQDKQEKERVDARNHLESLIFQVQHEPKETDRFCGEVVVGLLRGLLAPGVGRPARPPSSYPPITSLTHAPPIPTPTTTTNNDR